MQSNEIGKLNMHLNYKDLDCGCRKHCEDVDVSTREHCRDAQVGEFSCRLNFFGNNSSNKTVVTINTSNLEYIQDELDHVVKVLVHVCDAECDHHGNWTNE